MADSYNPNDHTVDQVNAYLDDNPDETGAVLQAEAEGQGRTGILQGRHATPEGGGSEGDTGTDAGAEGLKSTGNPNDLAVSQSDALRLNADALDDDTAPAHQDSAPEELTKVADEAAERGFLGVPRESKPDYSQRNPAVMGAESDTSQDD